MPGIEGLTRLPDLILGGRANRCHEVLVMVLSLPHHRPDARLDPLGLGTDRCSLFPEPVVRGRADRHQESLPVTLGLIEDCFDPALEPVALMCEGGLLP